MGVVAVLYRHHRDDPLSLAKLMLRDIGDTDVADFALLPELPVQGADRVLQRYPWVGPVEPV